MHISIDQALVLWASLEDCYNDRSSYGGTVAEIYAYTVLPFRPSFANDPMKALASPMIGEDSKKLVQHGAEALVQVVERFCEHRNCIAWIDEKNPREWLEEDQPYVHRCHIKINHKD